MFILANVGVGYVVKGTKFHTFEDAIEYKNKHYPDNVLHFLEEHDVDETIKAYWVNHWD